MTGTQHSTVADLALPEGGLGDIRCHQAQAMVGGEVDVLLRHHKILHGVVTGVFMLGSAPKIVVNGHIYDMNQVLTSTHTTP
jgi:hypothetical protein